MGDAILEILVSLLANMNERLCKLEELSAGEGFANYSTEELNHLHYWAAKYLEWLANSAKQAREAGGDG